MSKLILFFAVLILSAGTTVFADPVDQVITLKDGSQIKGQLAGIDNGVYTVKTPIIGDVHVAASDVASITNSAAMPAGGAASANTALPSPTDARATLDQEVATQQKKLMSNPQAMADLQEMASDPDIMQALSDPALVQAVTTHDYSAVQNNHKIQELMQNPKMKALLERIAAEQQQQNTTAQ